MSRVSMMMLILLAAPLAWTTQTPSFKPGKLPKEEVARLKPGLLLRFEDAKSAPLDARVSRLAALHVPEGSPPSPLLPPGPVHARLSGYLKVPLRGDFHFKIEGTGGTTLTINEKLLLKMEGGKSSEAMIELAKGYNLITLRHTGPAKGDATLRVSWRGEGFTWEPLPPDAMFHPGDAAEVVVGNQWRDGRFDFAILGCAQCHELPGSLLRKDAAMPEMERRPPSLKEAGKRFQEPWLAHWLLDPRQLRPEATMPRMLHGAAAQQQAADLAAFLGGVDPAPAFASPVYTEAQVQQGQKLFEKVGCIACHRLDDPKKEDPIGRLSLHHVGAKFKPGALEAFLKTPHEHYPWTRMPDFKLDAKEVSALSAYLLDQAKGAIESLPEKGDASRGAKLFREVGCASCHDGATGGPIVAATLLPAPSAQAKGCLAADAAARGKAPDFALAKEQAESLRLFLSKAAHSLSREAPAEFSHRQVKYLQCHSCHRRDGAFTRWHQVLEDEGTLPELLPHLTWAGEKLKPEWIARLLAGEHDHRARPWLKARMPAFPARAKTLSVGLSHEHGFGELEDPRPPFDANLAEIGKKLLPQQGGFNCTMCHAVGKTPALAPFEAPGINLLDAALRLRYPYYPRWMLDPPRVDITTRMVKLSQDGQTTPLRDVLGGDAHRQFDAIWHYMQTLPEK